MDLLSTVLSSEELFVNWLQGDPTLSELERRRDMVMTVFPRPIASAKI